MLLIVSLYFKKAKIYGAVSSLITHQIFWGILGFMPEAQLSVCCESSPDEILLSSTLNAGQLRNFTSKYTIWL